MRSADAPVPFHGAEVRDEPGGRRLLLLSYHFPPSSMAGALRWQRFAVHAAARGWRLDVVTLAPGDLRAPDPRRLADLPAGTRVFGVPRPAASRLDAAVDRIWGWYRRLRPIRPRGGGPTTPSAPAPPAAIVPREQIRWRFLAPADYRRAFHVWRTYAREERWSRAAGALARRLTSRTKYAAVISCGPPHMVHDAAWRVAAAGRVPFVMDLRDPWSLATAVTAPLASPVWLRLAARYEGRSVRHAALVVANTEPLRAAMAAAYPGANIVAVMNGYDEEPMPPTAHTRRFTIAYAGSIYIDRSPRLLFRAAARVVRELGLSPGDFAIELIGHLDDAGGATIADQASQEGIGAYVHTGPPRPRREALEFQARATMLLSLPQNVPLTIPSKIFEYMQFDAWMLVMARVGSAPEVLLRGTGADVVDPDDLEGLVTVLRRRYQAYAAGERPRRLAGIDRFSRGAQAERFFSALEACLR